MLTLIAYVVLFVAGVDLLFALVWIGALLYNEVTDVIREQFPDGIFKRRVK